jgi:photosystem II stability/assembly factor-like uncharacterized protein
VLLVVSIAIVLASGGSKKGKGSGNGQAATTLAPAHTGTTSHGSTPASTPPSTAVVAGTSSDPWVAQTIPPGVATSLFDISCVSAKACWVVGTADRNTTYCTTSSCTGSAVILATKDGGQSWVTQQYPTNTGLGASGFLFSVSCGSSSTCSAGGSGDQMALLSTHDGGATWVNGHYPSGLAGGHIFQVVCVGADHCWALGGQSATPFILATTDGGQSWSQQKLPSGLGLSANGLHSIACATTSRCVIAAEASNSLVILTTNDGGSSWSKQPYSSSISAKTQALGFVSCPTKSDCYITGYNTSLSGGVPVILATHDGGSTWVSQSYPSSLGLAKLTWVKCSDGAHCWSVGTAASGAVIVATSDGGRSWATQSIPSGLGLSSQGLIDVSCPKTSACLVIGTANSTPVVLAAKP